MDEHVYTSHNKTLLLYHLVIQANRATMVFIPEVEESLKEICVEIEYKREIRFVEIGLEEDHVHMLVQALPTIPLTRIVTIIKSLTERDIFRRHPNIKKDILWGGALWTSTYYAHTVGLPESRDTIKEYMQDQGHPDDYKKVYDGQIELGFWI